MVDSRRNDKLVGEDVSLNRDNHEKKIKTNIGLKVKNRRNNKGQSCSDNNIIWHRGKVSFKDRCQNLDQIGQVLWFTGLSGSGKSTIAVEVERALLSEGKAVYRLDGDNIRHGLNSDLGFSTEGRKENIRRIAEVAALFKDAGLIVLVSFISPYKESREFARTKVGKEFFKEIFVKVDLEICIERDPKGLYKKALAGEIKGFTGVSAPYQIPEKPDLILNTGEMSVEESVNKVLSLIKSEDGGEEYGD